MTTRQVKLPTREVHLMDLVHDCRLVRMDNLFMNRREQFVDRRLIGLLTIACYVEDDIDTRHSLCTRVFVIVIV